MSASELSPEHRYPWAAGGASFFWAWPIVFAGRLLGVYGKPGEQVAPGQVLTAMEAAR